MTEPSDSQDFSGVAPHCDAAQWDRLVEAIGPDSLLVIFRRGMSKQLASFVSEEDVFQETLALAWRDREQHRWEGVRAYRAWILTIARNRLTDLARRATAGKRGGARQMSAFSDLDDGDDRPFSQRLPAGSTTPSRIAIQRERAQVMADALASLPEEIEPVVRLYLFEEKPMEQIAAELSIGLSAAWYRFRKGSTLYAQALEVLRTKATQQRGAT